MPFNIGSLGNFKLTIKGSFEEEIFVSEDKTEIKNVPFCIQVDRIDTATGFDLLKNCPISFGQMDNKHREDIGDKKLSELRKEEHQYIIFKIEKFFPEDFRPKLKYIPYLTFIGMVDYMMTGEEFSQTLSEKMIKILNDLRKKISERNEELKKKLKMDFS